jgi:hypothetical protein
MSCVELMRSANNNSTNCKSWVSRPAASYLVNDHNNVAGMVNGQMTNSYLHI